MQPCRSVQAAASAPLPPVQALRAQDGPPLFVLPPRFLLARHPHDQELTSRTPHAGPWVNNCVGHGNYGHFCRFLFFVDVACAYHLWMISTRAFHSLAFSVDPSTFQIVMLVLNYTACVPVVIAVGVFSLYHLWSVLVNTTTIEGWEKDKVATLRRRGKIHEVRSSCSLRLSPCSRALVVLTLCPSSLARSTATRTTSATLPISAPSSGTTRSCGSGRSEQLATACRTLSPSEPVSARLVAVSRAARAHPVRSLTSRYSA